mgnify:CR=1 FL=1
MFSFREKSHNGVKNGFMESDFGTWYVKKSDHFVLFGYRKSSNKPPGALCQISKKVLGLIQGGGAFSRGGLFIFRDFF